MRFVFILFSLTSFGAFAKTISFDSLRAEQRSEGLFIIHQVEEKETLYSIARRYGGSVDKIIAYNDIVDNAIDIGQVIEVLVVENQEQAQEIDHISAGIHVVAKGETLYSISRLYSVKVKDLKKWNTLQSNELSLGMTLKVYEDDSDVIEMKIPNDSTQLTELDSSDMVVDPYEGFEEYQVQTGETLISIAQKMGVNPDSIRIWNRLESDYLKIGQQLFYLQPEARNDMAMVENREGKRKSIDEDGFERTYEEGIASVIASMNTSRYLALHATLPIGTNVEVRNLMNNQVVYVKVVGKLPKTGLNKNLLIRLSKSAYEQLGILDSKARVEVSYYEQ